MYKHDPELVRNAEMFMKLSRDGRWFIDYMSWIWDAHYEHNADLRHQMLHRRHPHSGKSEVLESDRICLCQWVAINEGETEFELRFPMCICFGTQKTNRVMKVFTQYIQETIAEGARWDFQTESERKFCMRVWNDGKFGDKWKNLDEPPRVQAVIRALRERHSDLGFFNTRISYFI